MRFALASLLGLFLAGYGYAVAGLQGALFVGGMAAALGVGTGLTLRFGWERKAARSKASDASRSFDLNDPHQAKRALDIAGAYGSAIKNSGVCQYHPVESLPRTKDSIRIALEALLPYCEGNAQSAYLNSIGVAPSSFVGSLRIGLRSLDDYLDVPAKTIPSEPSANAVFGDAIREGKSVAEARTLARLRQKHLR